MTLNDFRTQEIKWDKANRQMFTAFQASSGDSNGRKLSVQVLDEGKIVDLTGIVLSLAWQTKDKKNYGLDAFRPVDATKGIFEIFYTTEMLSNTGTLRASLVLVDGTGRVESDSFSIMVKDSVVNDSSVQSENSFTALTEALVQISKYQSDIDGIKQDLVDESNQLITTEKAELDALQLDYANRAEALEETYAPRLTEVTAQLAQNEQAVKSARFREEIKPIVSFLCDDGYVDDYHKLKPISELTGVPITLAIVTNQMDNDLRIFSHTHMPKLRELVDVYGYEVTSHTADHKYLSTLTYAEQEHQLRLSKEQLEAYGFEPQSIVYPYGSYNEDTLKIAPKYYDYGYRAGTNTMNDSPIDSFMLGRIQFDLTNPNNNLEWYKSKVDEAIAGNKWVIFMLHCSPTLGWMEAPQQQMLIDLMNYVKSVEVEMMTCHEAYLRFRNVYETTDGKYRIGAKIDNNPLSQSRYLPTDSNINNTTKLNDFPLGISYKTFIRVEAFPFPENSAGTLITHNFTPRVEHSYQEWHPYNSKNVYRRGCLASGEWSGFEKQGENDIFFQTNVSTNATTPFNYPLNKITVESLNSVYIPTQEFPVTSGSGVLTTVVGETREYVYQELKGGNGEVFFRTGINNVWSAWTTVTTHIKSTQISSWNLGTIPAQSAIEITKVVSGCTVNDFPLVNPKILLPMGLVFNAVITEVDTITVRVSNITNSPIVGGTRHWAVKVITNSI